MVDTALLFRYRSEFGPVVQLVRTPACHAGGRRFEPVLGRHAFNKANAFLYKSGESRTYAAIAQSVERILGKDEVTSSNLVSSSKSLTSKEVRLFLVQTKENHAIVAWLKRA